MPIFGLAPVKKTTVVEKSFKENTGMIFFLYILKFEEYCFSLL